MPWIITSGANTPTITYTAGNGVATFTLTVTKTTNGVTCTNECELLMPAKNSRFCSYTQGFFGNSGGTACDGDDTPEFLKTLLKTPLVLGGGANTLTLDSNDVNSWIMLHWNKVVMHDAGGCTGQVRITLRLLREWPIARASSCVVAMRLSTESAWDGNKLVAIAYCVTIVGRLIPV